MQRNTWRFRTVTIQGMSSNCRLRQPVVYSKKFRARSAWTKCGRKFSVARTVIQVRKRDRSTIRDRYTFLTIFLPSPVIFFSFQSLILRQIFSTVNLDPSSECHVLFEWPLITTFKSLVLIPTFPSSHVSLCCINPRVRLCFPGSAFSSVWFWSTVKSVYNDHSWDPK